MLRELTIENLALIDHLRLEFEQGFNIFTGETGAGKSIIIDGVNLILGGRASSELVRAGTESAQVEAVFELEEDEDLEKLLGEWNIPLGEDRLLVINREVQALGRSRCRLNGQTVTVLTLSKVGAYLIDLHGQHEHQSLLFPDKQRAILDEFGGEELMAKAREVRRVYQRWEEVREELQQLSMREEDKNRKIELLNFQLEEIERARLQPAEEEELLKEQELLAGAEELYAASSLAYQVLYGGEEPGSALDKLTEGSQALERVAAIDPRLRSLYQMVTEAACQVEEAAREARSYRDRVEFDPSRLAAVEERLDELSKLKRKYGKSIEEILVYADTIRAELQSIEGREERLAVLAEEKEELEEKLAREASLLSALRQEAADRLGEAIALQLVEVNMGKTVFQAVLTRTPDKEGLPMGEEKWAISVHGFDRVEFMVAPNPGEGMRPLAKIASGGELSRMMLALKVILAEADPIPTMVFDEIDVGIGGRTSQAVAEKLLLLAQTNQVICVTHLPQIASMANRHFQVKKTPYGSRTRVEVQALSFDERVEELARMLGGAKVTSTTREHAREMLSLAESVRLRKDS